MSEYRSQFLERVVPDEVIEPDSHYSTPRSSGVMRQGIKRAYDLVFSTIGLVVLAPVFLLIALAIKATDGGHVIFSQIRVGAGGRHFRLFKFRTMIVDAEQKGPRVTKDGDNRITWIGRLLRRSKLDELPQLWNVFIGDMSLVGPRPEVPRYIREYTPEQRTILNLKPGITDLASLCFRDEESLLRDVDNVEEFYLKHCVPRKVHLNKKYAEKATVLTDTWIILQTICPRWIGLLSVYALILCVSFWFSHLLIHNFERDGAWSADLLPQMISVVSLQLGFLVWRNQCRGLLSYFSIPEAKQVVVALAVACGLRIGLGILAPFSQLPVNILVTDLLVSICLLAGFRLWLRFLRESCPDGDSCPSQSTIRVGVIGAGETGSHLAKALNSQKGLNRTVVAFFDDDSQKWQKCIHEVPIVGMPECLLEGWTERLEEVVIALPSMSADRTRQLNAMLQKTSLRVYTVPSLVRFWDQELASEVAAT